MSRYVDKILTKEKKIEFIMRTIWNSIDTHFYYIHTKKNHPQIGNRKFHKQRIKEYMKCMKFLSELL